MMTDRAHTEPAEDCWCHKPIVDIEQVIPCASAEMRIIRGMLESADNDLISAQDRATGDVELSEEILKIRRPLNDLIQRIK